MTVAKDLATHGDPSVEIQSRSPAPQRRYSKQFDTKQTSQLIEVKEMEYTEMTRSGDSLTSAERPRIRIVGCHFHVGAKFR